MRILWEDSAWEDYLYWESQDRKTLKRLNLLLRDIKRSPYDGMESRNLSAGIYRVYGVEE